MALRQLALIFVGLCLCACQARLFNSLRAEKSIQEDEGRLELAKVCSSVDTRYIQNTLAPLFGINTNDVPMVDSNKNTLMSNACRTYRPTSGGSACGFLNTFTKELNDNSCGADKLKILVGLYINGCSMGLSTNSLAKSLFAEGSSDPTQLYLYLVGRDLSSDEREVFDELRSNIDGIDAQRIAVCATVASSYSGITIN